MVQLCFWESAKPIFDKFLESFQVEGPLIHNLYPCMVLLLKQMMSWFLKPKVLQKKTVAELLKLDMKHSDSQLKDSELEIGLPTRQALNYVKNSGMQKQCYLGSKVIIHLYLAFLAMFLSESGNFLKYSFNAGNCFLTLSIAGIRESHCDCTFCKKTNSSRFSFCCTSA